MLGERAQEGFLASGIQRLDPLPEAQHRIAIAAAEELFDGQSNDSIGELVTFPHPNGFLAQFRATQEAVVLG